MPEMGAAMTNRRDQDDNGGGFGRSADRGGAGLARGGSWIGGAILVFVGLVFLLKNFGFPFPENWWAVFILIPAVASFAGARKLYQRNGGELSRGVVGGIAAGCVFVILSVLFLFGFDIGKFWPLILIVLGVGILSGALAPERNSRG